MLQDKIGDIKNVSDLGGCGTFDPAEETQFAAAPHAEPQQSRNSAWINWRWELEGNGAGRRERQF